MLNRNSGVKTSDPITQKQTQITHPPNNNTNINRGPSYPQPPKNNIHTYTGLSAQPPNNNININRGFSYPEPPKVNVNIDRGPSYPQTQLNQAIAKDELGKNKKVFKMNLVISHYYIFSHSNEILYVGGFSRHAQRR